MLFKYNFCFIVRGCDEACVHSAQSCVHSTELCDSYRKPPLAFIAIIFSHERKPSAFLI